MADKITNDEWADALAWAVRKYTPQEEMRFIMEIMEETVDTDFGNAVHDLYIETEFQRGFEVAITLAFSNRDGVAMKLALEKLKKDQQTPKEIDD